MNYWNKLVELLQSDKKWKVFGYILLTIVVLGTILSVLIKVIFHDDAGTRPQLAVVAPKGSNLVNALKMGSELYVNAINRKGGYKGRPLEILVIDETPQTAEIVTANKRVVAVVGHLNPQILKPAAALYAGKNLPVVTPLSLAETIPGVTSLGLDPKEQARFVANYARNIQLRRIMYVVREAGPDLDPFVDPFIEVYKRFETPVKQTWVISSGPETAMRLKTILEDIKKIDIGSVYIAASPALAAQIVKGIRETGNALDLFGPAPLASGEFAQTLAKLSGKDAAIQSHGTIVATPVLFDTANEEAQQFQTRYQRKFRVSPDWMATCAYDAAKVALSAKPGIDEVQGITGTLNFSGGRAQLPIQMGIYNGDRLISAPVQLLPIAKGASFNYIEALRNGRVLYVNDRFMFKSNVVYVGINLHELSDFDTQKDIATLDMSIWFRYRGNFNPQDLQIPNAVETVKFEKPEESKESDEVQYRRYRFKQKFKLNFTTAPRAYDQEVAGITFRHRLLNRNNLTYVVDVMGMPTGSALIDDLLRRNVVNANTGWAVDNAWVSQDVVREQGDGAPQYVGMTGEQPFFSKISLGILLKPASATARDIIPGEHFIYIAIFGLLGALFGVALDSPKWGRKWVVQSWLLRVIFWPLVLLSAGNIALDWAFGHLSPSATKTFVIIYESLWWIVAARLADMAVRRFIWAPLEVKTQRKVPDVMKFFVSLLLFILAVAGITAFVFNKTLTSLLATSGVLAMVIGLAIQSNIANVFSGIILNIERPFKVGDYIKINNLIGQVKDITWRTTRIESNDGQTLIMANSKVSEAFMENYSQVPHGIAAETKIYAPPEVDPAKVLAIIEEGVAQSKAIICKDDPDSEFAPMPRFKGIVNIYGQWVAEYSVGYRVKILPKKSKAKEQIWSYVRQKFIENNIALIPSTAFTLPVGEDDASKKSGGNG
ncbi:MAG: mechanosensitive ion channel domain-containing protein [Pseudomonadota bacterium]